MALDISIPSLLVKQLFDRESCTCSYLLIDSKSREAAILDPVKEQFERDSQLIEELSLELIYTIETHTHADHITASGLIRQSTGAQIALSAASSVKGIDIALSDGEKLPLGNYSITAISTPGHTTGCMSFYVDGMLFTGDTLFVRGCGRTDFQGGSADILYDSVTRKLFSFPNETRVYPGHDYTGRLWSTIGEEKKWNPRLAEIISRVQFVEIMNNLHLSPPQKIDEAMPANMSAGSSYDPYRYIHDNVTIAQLFKAWKELSPDQLIVDTRSPESFNETHIPGSVNIALGTEEEHTKYLSSFKKIYLCSRTGRAAQKAFTTLTLSGLNNLVCVNKGGITEWSEAGYPVTNTLAPHH